MRSRVERTASRKLTSRYLVDYGKTKCKVEEIRNWSKRRARYVGLGTTLKGARWSKEKGGDRSAAKSVDVSFAVNETVDGERIDPWETE